MRKLREWSLRISGLFNKERKDRELDEEIESHLQLLGRPRSSWARRAPPPARHQ